MTTPDYKTLKQNDETELRKYENELWVRILENPRNRSGKGNNEIQYQVYDRQPDDSRGDRGLIATVVVQWTPDDQYTVDAQHIDGPIHRMDGILGRYISPPEDEKFNDAEAARSRAATFFDMAINGDVRGEADDNPKGGDANTENNALEGTPQNYAPLSPDATEFEFGEWKVFIPSGDEPSVPDYHITRPDRHRCNHVDVFINQDSEYDEVFVIEAHTEAGVLNQGYNTAPMFLAGLDMTLGAMDLLYALLERE